MNVQLSPVSTGKPCATSTITRTVYGGGAGSSDVSGGTRDWPSQPNLRAWRAARRRTGPASGKPPARVGPGWPVRPARARPTPAWAVWSVFWHRFPDIDEHAGLVHDEQAKPG